MEFTGEDRRWCVLALVIVKNVFNKRACAISNFFDELETLIIIFLVMDLTLIEILISIFVTSYR